MTLSALPASLQAALASPSREFSPAAIWWWSGEPLTRSRLRWQLERLVEGGVWNLVILNLAPSGPLFGSDADDPPFLSEAWWELLDGVCADASELGARLWLYDQLGFSGADLQARLVQERPSFAGRWLGERPGDAVEERGFDYLGVEACATLLDGIHGEVERRLGRWLGSTIAGFFQDELPALPTWSRGFAEAFAARHGYELDASLLWGGAGGAAEAGGGALAGGGAEAGGGALRANAAERARRDYHVTRAALAEEAFFKPLNAWHERHGLICGCDQQDPARAGRPVEGVQLYADYARTHRWFGAPGSDHHGDARIHASLAHLYERPRVWIEAFHSSGWGGTLEETFDWLVPWLRGGATLYNPHAVYSSTKAGWWEWAPPATDWRQPYWRHHRVFADAVARLCQTLSLGRHRCDVAVLLPTADAQAGALPDGTVLAHAARAQSAYVELVGDMAWFDQRPGALDRIGRDADVIDDDSLQRAVVDGPGTGTGTGTGTGAGAGPGAAADAGGASRLRVADEAYGAVVLPACTVVEDATAARLAEFAEAGGVVVAVGAAPERAVGAPAADRGAAVANGGADGADRGASDAPGLARLRAAFATGRATVVPVGDDDALAAALEPVAAVAESDAPMLVREVDGTLVTFLTAAAPSATRVAVDAPEERGVGFGWLHPRIDFDRSRYAPGARVRVRGEHASALLVSPFDGSARVVAGAPAGDGTEFAVPFDDGPAALLLVPPSAAVGAGAPTAPPSGGAGQPPAVAPLPAGATIPLLAAASASPTGAMIALPATWSCELVPTLENDWGDLARPAAPGAPPLERWELRWRVERAGEDGRRDGWASPAHYDGGPGWSAAHATFGPGAIWTGPAAPHELPDPARDETGGIAERAGDPADVANADAAGTARASTDDGADDAGAARASADGGADGAGAATAEAGGRALAWREAVWSRSRGIHKDLLHQHGTLGPKGHVPEEFLDLGSVGAGEAVHMRARIELPPDAGGVLAIGAAAAKRLWIDGAELTLDDAGHLAFTTFALGTGCHLIDLRLTAEEQLGHLRAHLAVVREEAVDRYRRPEWIAAAAPAAVAPAPVAPALAASVSVASVAPDAPAESPGAAAAAPPAAAAPSEVALDLHLRAKPARAVVQVAAYAPCALRVNGAVVGRQGGFDPYAEQDVPRVRRYDVTDALRAGDNELAVELPAPASGEPLPAVLVDALIDERIVCSGPGWRARLGGEPVALTTRRAQAGDPASLHLTRRPHPLPGAAWLDPGADDGSVLPLPLAVPRDATSAADGSPPSLAGGASAGRVEWLRFPIPPGTRAIDVRVRGEATLFVDGVAQSSLTLEPAARARLGALRTATRPGFERGAALEAPIRFEVGPGEVALGDWQQVGLPEYSGGVRYTTTLDLADADAARTPAPRDLAPASEAHTPATGDLAPASEAHTPATGDLAHASEARTAATLHLGELRGTAEVRVNGVDCGTRICAPYRFGVGHALRDGANEIEVLVLGTLGPYLDAVSPTHFVFDGQRTTGLFGPVTLHLSSSSND